MSDKVGFVLGGAQKSGTSAIDLYLREHPDISMPLYGKKELHFFDFDERYFEGESSYHRHFEWTTSKVRGEVTPVYMYWETVLSRMYAYNPKIKIIIVLRHPVDRAFSHWNMEYSRGREKEVFEKAVEKELYHLLVYGKDYQHRFLSYIGRGFYATQMRKILCYFPESQLLILNYSEFNLFPNKALNRIYDFLGVSRRRVSELKYTNSGQYAHEMSPDIRKLLCQLYKQEIVELEEMLGWDLVDWLS